MTADARPLVLSPRMAWLALAAAVAVLVLALLFAQPRAIVLGVLSAWLFCLSVTVGGSVWLLIGALTGGRWLAVAGPGLIGLARMTWIVALFGALFIIAGRLLFPWWDQGGGAVQTLWLAPASFMARAACILVLWSVIGLLADRLTPLWAALVLVAHGIAVSVAGVDWVLSLDPSFVSTAFGAQLAILQLTLALATVAILRPAGKGSDIGALLLACILGVFYLAGMGFVVSWSGNLPDKAEWYLARQDGGGLALIWISFALGALAPFCLLLGSAVRSNPVMLRWVGAMIVVGGLLHLVWLSAPGAFAGAGSSAAAVAVGVGAAFLLLRGGIHGQ